MIPQQAVGDPSPLEQFANQEIVYITRFPNELPNKFSFISQLFQDNSIAIGKIFNPR